ncbi:MAG: helix-turn-helix transcriptional regulator [Dehalococcoidales bacterium]|nr:helix-turn-helix transcriptional regulator [Dehalococcoidales bacterium]
MGMLKGKDVDEIINLMQLCPSPLKTSDDINRFFLETQKVFEADELVFLYPDNQTNGIDLKRSFNLRRDRSFLSRYADYFWRLDPLYSAEFSAEHNMPAFRTEDVMPYSHFVKSEYYYDFLQPQNLFSELAIRLCFKSYFLGAISLLRSKNRPFFDKNDVRKAELIIPYIINTIDVDELFFRHFEEQKLFEQWLETQSEGIILLDSNFHTLYYNARANLFGLLLTGRKSAPAHNDESRDIYIPDVIIRDCICLARSNNGKNILPGYDNRIVNMGTNKRYHIQYFIFSSNNSEIDKPRFVIIINDLSRYGIDTEQIILSQAKLSNREAVVARFAGMGWTNKEIADTVHSSPFTVQNQLKRIFEKTGLKNRTQLANLMKYSDSIDNLR